MPFEKSIIQREIVVQHSQRDCAWLVYTQKSDRRSLTKLGDTENLGSFTEITSMGYLPHPHVCQYF